MDEGDRHAAHRMRHVLAVVGNGPAIERVDAGEDLDERRFARAVLAEQRDDLAASDAERRVGKRLRAAETFIDVAGLKHGARARARSSTRFLPSIFVGGGRLARRGRVVNFCRGGTKISAP